MSIKEIRDIQDRLYYYHIVNRRGVELYEELNDPGSVGLDEILTSLNSSGDLDCFKRGFQYIGFSSSEIDIKRLAVWLIESSCQEYHGFSMSSLVHDYITKDVFDASMLTLLSGISVDDEYDIGCGVKLISPFHVTDKDLNMSAHEVSLFNTPYPGHSGVLMLDFEHPKYHSDHPESAQLTGFMDKTQQRLEDARLCLAISRPNGYAVQGLSSTVITPDYVPNLVGKRWRCHSYRATSRCDEFSKDSIDVVKSLLGKLNSLNEPDRERVRLPMRKLSEYYCSESLSEGAICLRTALESVFLGDDAKQELSHRLAIRAARLLGSDYQERELIYKLVKKGYNLGSAAVHTGKIKSGNNERKCLQDISNLLVQAITTLLSNPNPDWNKIELGNG